MQAIPAFPRPNRRPSRDGAALVFTLLGVFMCTMLLVQILDTQTLNAAALRNTLDYQRALYLANAGVHAVAAELEADPTWRGVLTEGAYPAHDTYTVSAVSGADLDMVIVTASGVSGDRTRTISAKIEL